MTASITSGPIGDFDVATRDQASPKRIIDLACFGDGTQAQRITAQNEILHRPDFIVHARMTENADTLTLLDLTALGVTFPAGTQRVVEYECHISGATAATESGYLHARNMIVGGTTPVLGIVIGAIDTNMAGAVGGFTGSDPTLAFTMATNNVTLVGTNEGADEINNWVLKVWIGKLQPVVLGV